ncbi:MAG: efflux transporter outer membrane subunit [Syntrophaceae bacterium]|nr:efflux transporter outer membrane subunit [Syntrophaceae bacterium]
MSRKTFLLLAVVTALLGGCTLAPEYTRPASPVPADWPAGAAYKETKAAAPAPAASELPWREFITDERLRKVIETSLSNNRDLRLAILNVEKAEALYGVQRASLLPSVNATGSVYRERIPADLSSSGTDVISRKNSVTAGVSAWEIDFFGRLQSLKDEAWEQYLATDQDRRSAQIMLVSAVANAYFALAADRENLKLAAATLEAQETTYNLVRKRHDVGLVSALTLRQAQSQVEAARGSVARYTQLVAQDENALHLLAGSPLPPGLLPESLTRITPPAEIASGLSSDPLLKRPDVLAAEHRLKAAHANIGAARAAFFPRISLSTTIGTASAELSGLFRAGSAAWTFAPQIVLPIFDARTWSAYEVTKVVREMAVAQYEKAIQTAFREAADALVVRGTVEQQIEAQEALVEALAEASRLSNARYEKGIDSYLGVLDAQRSLYGAQQGLISLRLARYANLVTLYKVLGGGV